MTVPTIDVAVITDGRRMYLERCMTSLSEMVPWDAVAGRYIVNDAGDDRYTDWLDDTYGGRRGWTVISHEERCGLAATVDTAWAFCKADMLFHVEEDFIFRVPVELPAMRDVLTAYPRLAQLCLLRQPWSSAEHAAGGIIPMDPDAYHEQVMCGRLVVTHQRVFSLNPCLIPRTVLETGWPSGNEAEQTARLVEAGWIFGYWGSWTTVEHIGTVRSTSWML